MLTNIQSCHVGPVDMLTNIQSCRVGPVDMLTNVQSCRVGPVDMLTNVQPHLLKCKLISHAMTPQLAVDTVIYHCKHSTAGTINTPLNIIYYLNCVLQLRRSEKIIKYLLHFL